MDTKKVLAVVFSIIFILAFGLAITWGVINSNKDKEGMSGTQIYTSVDLENAYQDGYDTALKDKDDYEELVVNYRSTIANLTDSINSLNAQLTSVRNSNNDYQTKIANNQRIITNLENDVARLTGIKNSNETTINELGNQVATLQAQVLTLTSSNDNKTSEIEALNLQINTIQTLISQLQTTNENNLTTISSLNAQILELNSQISTLSVLASDNQSQFDALNAEIARLQSTIEYYEECISALEEDGQVVATFEVNGSVYEIQLLDENTCAEEPIFAPDEHHVFNYWTVDGERVDLTTYPITTSTKFVANMTNFYDVVFMVDNENYDTQLIEENSTILNVPEPTKEFYEFEGWSINGVDIIENIEEYEITRNTTFRAVFSRYFTVNFVYENEIIDTQTVKNGEFATSVNGTSTTYKTFNGWTINGTVVDIASYTILADTTFTASITYSYDVVFMIDDTVYNSQVIRENNFASLPEAPTKVNYSFNGWSIDGENVVDILTYEITHNITFIALFDNSEPLISFTIDGQTYYTVDGMTWQEWIASEYNTDETFEESGFYFGEISYSGMGDVIDGVYYEDEIIAGQDYTSSPRAYCFVAGTKILTSLDGETTNIENLNIGDDVVSLNLFNNKMYVAKIKDIVVTENVSNIVRLTLANGTTIEMTEGHPILCKGAFKTICDTNEEHKLKVGDEVYTINGYSEIVSIEYLTITTTVYNLNVIGIDEVDDVDTYDNFFANGICVHNIAPVDEYPREPQGYQYQDVPIHSGGSN